MSDVTDLSPDIRLTSALTSETAMNQAQKTGAQSCSHEGARGMMQVAP